LWYSQLIDHNELVWLIVRQSNDLSNFTQSNIWLLLLHYFDRSLIRLIVIFLINRSKWISLINCKTIKWSIQFDIIECLIEHPIALIALFSSFMIKSMDQSLVRLIVIFSIDRYKCISMIDYDTIKWLIQFDTIECSIEHLITLSVLVWSIMIRSIIKMLNIYYLKNLRDKCKISFCSWLKLQIASCGIKMNSKILVVCQKNNLLSRVKFH
jgi:hypothetical protein